MSDNIEKFRVIKRNQRIVLTVCIAIICISFYSIVISDKLYTRLDLIYDRVIEHEFPVEDGKITYYKQYIEKEGKSEFFSSIRLLVYILSITNIAYIFIKSSYYKCPVCKKIPGGLRSFKYCGQCGERLAE